MNETSLQTEQLKNDVNNLLKSGGRFLNTLDYLDNKKEWGFLDWVMLIGTSVSAWQDFNKTVESGKEFIASLQKEIELPTPMKVQQIVPTPIDAKLLLQMRKPDYAFVLLNNQNISYKKA